MGKILISNGMIERCSTGIKVDDSESDISIVSTGFVGNGSDIDIKSAAKVAVINCDFVEATAPTKPELRKRYFSGFSF